jgi:hypothetical protein
MATFWYRLWGWLRFPLAIVAAFLVAVFVGIIWLLSGQRYQLFLTQQLGALLDAQVQVAGSRLSFASGLGIEFDSVVVQGHDETTPVFTTDRINILLDTVSLFRGRLLFHRIDCVRPRVQLSAQGEVFAVLDRILRTSGERAPTDEPTSGWFSPTLAVHHLGLYDGEITYTGNPFATPLIFTHTEVFLSHTDGADITVYVSTMVGEKGALGTIILQGQTAPRELGTALSQAAWSGKILLQQVPLYHVGRLLGARWVQTTLDFDGQYQGMWNGPVGLSGELQFRDTQVGVVRLNEGKAVVRKLSWSRQEETASSSIWSSWLRAMAIEAEVKDLYGEIGEKRTPVTLHRGEVTWQDGAVKISQVQGVYGQKSRITEGEGTFQGLFSGKKPKFALRLTADVDLQQELDDLLAIRGDTTFTNFSQNVTEPHGRALVQLSARSSESSGAIRYDTQVVFQQAGFHIPAWNRDVTALTGAFQVSNASISSEKLTWKLGESSLQVTGRIDDYLVPRRKVDVRLVADLQLEDLGGIPQVFAREKFSQYVTQPGGRALVQLDLQTVRPRDTIAYSGEVVFQQAEFFAPGWNTQVSNLAGTVKVGKDSVSTDALSFKMGQSSVQLQGSIHNYLVAQRYGNLHLQLTGVQDHDLTPFLPQGLVQPQGGTLEGQVDVTLISTGTVTTTGTARFHHVRLDPLSSLLRPIEVKDGELTWQGETGTFTIQQASLPGGDFSGSGRFLSLHPLNLELSAVFPSLDLESALQLDQQAEENSAPKDTTVVVRADLDIGQFVHKAVKAENVHLSCHWHDRQADLRLTRAHVVGGTIQGKGILWPDVGGLFIAPELTTVDAHRFFATLGVLTNIRSGMLSGKGEIYVTDWQKLTSLAHWDATLSLAVKDGVVKGGPILIRLWSALSLQGLLSFQLPSLPNGELTFSSMTGDVTLGKGLAVTNNFVLKSSAVQIDTRGEIDLTRGTVDLTTAVVPLYGITSSVAKVPLAGELLARGTDLLTTLSFRVRGPYADPTVTPLLVNTGKP